MAVGASEVDGKCCRALAGGGNICLSGVWIAGRGLGRGKRRRIPHIVTTQFLPDDLAL
jgi:hypothetical protein